MEIIGKRTCGADADNVVNIVEVEQLPAVNADGRYTHAGCHNGNGNSLVGAGIALNTAYVIHEDGVLNVIFGNELGSQRIAGHKHGFCKCALRGIDVRGGNRHINFLLV